MKKDTNQSRASTINLFGGAICLDFTNTVDWRTSGNPEEILTSYRDLVDWSRHAGTIDQRSAARLNRSARSRPEKAARVLGQAIELREAIYQVFVAVARSGGPSGRQLSRLNALLSPLVSQARIQPAGPNFVWGWSGDRNRLDSVLWPLAWSAGELLTSQDLKFIRECPGAGCGWLFLDKSRSRRRQWCDMKGCGNRAKARRFYERQRASLES